MKIRFSVTYQIVSQESAKNGYIAEDGFITTSACLRDAIDDVLATHTNLVDGQTIENTGRWITVDNGMEFETGEYENRSIRPLFNITPASYTRLCRLLGV